MSKILVVDDEIGVRELLSDILSDEGSVVVTAESAESTRKCLSRESFDLILLDVWMPDADGVSLLKELSACHLLPCPVITLCNHASIETAAEAWKYGAIDCLEKPVAMAKLIEAVQHGLRVSERLRTLAPYRPEPPTPKVPKAEAKEKPVEAALPVLEVPGTGFCIDFTRTLREVKDDTERAYLKALMNAEHNNMSNVAKRAGMLRSHLYRKMRALGIPAPRYTALEEAEAREDLPEVAEV